MLLAMRPVEFQATVQASHEKIRGKRQLTGENAFIKCVDLISHSSLVVLVGLKLNCVLIQHVFLQARPWTERGSGEQ